MTKCQLEYAQSGRADTVPCEKPAVGVCADCGTLICSNCCSSCCGDSFCGQCYDHHIIHSCVQKPVQKERGSFPNDFRRTFDKAS
jgi:hypothetical protein